MAGHDFFVRINFADVPDAGDEQAAIGLRRSFFSREESPPLKTRFMGASPYSLGESENRGRLVLFWPFFALGAPSTQDFRGTPFSTKLTRWRGDTFAIEGRTQLFRMVGIIANGNIFCRRVVYSCV